MVGASAALRTTETTHRPPLLGVLCCPRQVHACCMFTFPMPSGLDCRLRPNSGVAAALLSCSLPRDSRV
uniref:Putative secreted protein n=1 Tax=Anopheles marajoara TaxID=58244 RepID=A0A2M4CEZ4_9DIPT